MGLKLLISWLWDREIILNYLDKPSVIISVWTKKEVSRELQRAKRQGLSLTLWLQKIEKSNYEPRKLGNF